MKIAFCGTRGIPANYGGFETAVEEIATRFAGAGYDCEIFCRSHAYPTQLSHYRSCTLTYVAGSRIWQLDTFISSLQTGWHILRHRKDYRHVFWFNNANLPGILLTRLAGVPTSVNTDGLEWRRPKWKGPFKLYYFLSSALVAWLCPSLISDSQELARYYKFRFGVRSTVIPYGAPPARSIDPARARTILERYGVEAGRYTLQITRVEPDNLPLEVARGFVASGLAEQGYRHLLIGYKHDTPYSLQLKQLAASCPAVRVCPAEYDPDVVAVLRAQCALYVHGNSVGGTNPALLEAMAACPRVVASEGVFNREVLGELGRYFRAVGTTAPSRENVAEVLRAAVATAANGAQLQRRVRANYDWDAVARAYMALAEGKAVSYAQLVQREQPAFVDGN